MRFFGLSHGDVASIKVLDRSADDGGGKIISQSDDCQFAHFVSRLISDVLFSQTIFETIHVKNVTQFDSVSATAVKVDHIAKAQNGLHWLITGQDGSFDQT